MSIPKIKSTHIGRKIERIREFRGMKQDTLAASLGISQQAVSRMEQSEEVDGDKLAKVAEILGVTVDAIRNFNEDTVISNINTFHDSSALNFQCHFNPLDKLIEIVEENKKLYERLLESERQKSELLESLLKKMKSSK
jgi:transcriptional regulator with XRE-family HTH domain